jgi:hypothetical protein
MRRPGPATKWLLILLVGWLMGVPGYCGYALVSDADFLATLPQLENPDLDASLVAEKSLCLWSVSPVHDVGYHQPDGLFMHSFLEMSPTKSLTFIRRC